jgi:very-long-chain (3R)-3-hydroxyacyl-CoA dehydratase
MNRPGDAQKPSTQGRQSSKPLKSASQSSKSSYLIFYNLVSAALWSVVIAQVLRINATDGHEKVYAGVGEYTKWTQTLAGLEVLHAALGRWTFSCFRPVQR